MRLAVIAILFLAPLSVLHFGYLPPDDALRHAAKAVSGKAWPEILVLRREITMDHNPGWSFLLHELHRLLGWDAEKLARFSVVSMFLAMALGPVFCLRRAEAWLGSLTLILLVFPYFADRAFVGRPLFITMGVALVLLWLWKRPLPGQRPVQRVGFTIGLVAISSWVHGSWYLLALVPLAFFLAQEWRKGALLTAGWLTGSVLGALLTGSPQEFLSQSVLIPMLALGGDPPANSLVGEFQPFSGGWPGLVIVGTVVLWRWASRRPLGTLHRDPVLWLAAIGFVLGFRVLRFWLDWGLPALALWLASQMEELLETRPVSAVWGRLAGVGVAGCVLLLGVTSDRDGRWSQYDVVAAPVSTDPQQAGWVPDPGGILYCVDLAVFYDTFFRNPRAEWRYILGFEPTFMRPEDLAVYRELWSTLNARQACAPWIARMRPEDRLVLRSGPSVAPVLPPLEWRYAASNYWIGRLPRGAGSTR